MKRQWGKFPWDLYWENKTYKLNRFIVLCFRHTMKLMRLDYLTYAELLSCVSIVNFMEEGGVGGLGLATAFDLAAFRLSMIAPVKKPVNHSRTVASMRETGCEQQQQVRFRSDSTVRSEFRITINEVPYELFTHHASWCPKGPLKKVIETFSWCFDAGKPKTDQNSSLFQIWRKICTVSLDQIM